MRYNILKSSLFLVTLALIAAACTVNVSPEGNPGGSASPEFSTPTLPATATFLPSYTPALPTITPTVQPVEGSVTTQINVRESPDKNSAAIGIIEAGGRVQIIAKSADGEWWMIQYEQAPGGLGWVTTEFVRVDGNPLVPVIDTSVGVSGLGTPTPTPPPGIQGKTTQKVNVRSGPGTSFNSLGTVENGQSVILTGKNDTGTWLQIFYPGGPGDRGWISAAYTSPDGDVSALPVFNEEGTQVSAGGEDDVSPQATPTATPVSPAADDADTVQKPGASIAFSPQNLRKFMYSSDVSYPDGDREDWVQFIPYTAQAGLTTAVFLNIECEGNGTLDVQLWRNGSAFKELEGFTCGTGTRLDLEGEYSYQLRIRPGAGTSGLQYILYTISGKVGE